MKVHWNDDSPIEIENGVMMTSGRDQDANQNSYILFVDLDHDNINVIHTEEGKTRTYFEKGKIALPKKFADDMATDLYKLLL